MVAASLIAPISLERERIDAERVACSALVQACERSLFELRCSLGHAQSPAEVRTGLRATEVLEGVLAGWRETLTQLRRDLGEAGGSEASTFTGR